MAFTSTRDPGFLSWWNDVGAASNPGYSLEPVYKPGDPGEGGYNSDWIDHYAVVGQTSDTGYYYSASGALPGLNGNAPAGATAFNWTPPTDSGSFLDVLTQGPVLATAAFLTAGAAYGAFAPVVEGAASTASLDAAFVAQDAAQLTGQGLSVSQVASTLEASGVDSFVAADTAQLAAQGIAGDQLALTVAQGAGSSAIFPATTSLSLLDRVTNFFNPSASTPAATAPAVETSAASVIPQAVKDAASTVASGAASLGSSILKAVAPAAVLSSLTRKATGAGTAPIPLPASYSPISGSPLSDTLRALPASSWALMAAAAGLALYLFFAPVKKG